VEIGLARPKVVIVKMTEFHYSYDPVIPAGRVVFRMVNDGHEAHWPSLVQLDEDLPPIDQQLHGSERRVVNPYAGVSPRGPGTSGSFAVDLAPGRRYAFICYATGRDGTVHYLKGMNSEFRAGQPPTPGR
jgi:hypothetical protein